MAILLAVLYGTSTMKWLGSAFTSFEVINAEKELEFGYGRKPLQELAINSAACVRVTLTAFSKAIHLLYSVLTTVNVSASAGVEINQLFFHQTLLPYRAEQFEQLQSFFCNMHQLCVLFNISKLDIPSRKICFAAM